jgi:CHAT domain-containing protein
VADGHLCYVPFELLVEGAERPDGGHYLLEQHRLRYAPSLTALHLIARWEKGRARQPDQALWALGDPDYGTAETAASRAAEREVRLREGRGESFPRLVQSGQEVRAVARLLGVPESAVRTRARASESAVKQASQEGELARARYLHFATHGILGLDTGQPPALVLSLVGTTGRRDEWGVDDGFLRLDEVLALKLNADLVVLSACRSGQGRLYNGEGVSGLARAFLHAGSRGVVCSLWNVDDAATSTLMQGMYARLQKGEAAGEALRQAQLELLRAGRPAYYWAPFILIGK